MSEDPNLVTLDCPTCGQTISVPTGVGASTFGCPLCGAEFEIEGAAETVLLPAAASPAMEVMAAAAAAAPSAPQPAAVVPHRGRAAWSGGAIAGATILIVGGALAVGAFFAMQTPVGDLEGPAAGQAEWVDAAKGGYTIEGVTVRVQRVEVGPVRAKNKDGSVFVSDRQDYWAVRLRIHNGSPGAIEFRTWHAAEFPGSALRAASVKDEAGRRFVMQAFEDVALLQGQTLRKTLPPGEAATDVIVLEAPAELDRERLKELRLELPGAACGVEGVFRQVVPKSLVE